MQTKTLDLIDFKKVDTLLEGFNKSTGFVTAILDLDGNVLSKSGWRQICTEFHRIHPETAKRCLISDTELANKMAEGEKYHFYQCLNGLVDVAVPIVIKGEHVANLFSGQFFFEKPESAFFQKQATKYGFKQEIYLKALEKVPIVSEEKVKVVLDFLLNMTQMISEMTFQKLEQKELNKTLRESERKLREAQEMAHLGNWHWEVKSGKVKWSDEVYKIFGLNPNEFTPHIDSILAFSPWPEDHQRDRELINKAMESHNRGSYEQKFLRPDKSIGHYYSTFQGNYDEKGELISIVGTILDITERKIAEETLMESENKFRAIFENNSAAIAIIEPDTTISMVNDAYCQISGYSKQEVVGMSWTKQIPPADLERLKEYNQKRLLNPNDAPDKYEFTFFHKNGDIKHALMSVAMIQGNNKIVSSFIDVTERKLAEEVLKKEQALNNAIIESIPGTFYMLDETGQYVRWNAYQRDEIVGKPDDLVGSTNALDTIHPDDRELIQSKIANVLANGVDETVESRVLLRGGPASRWLVMTGRRMFIDGHPFLVGTGIDITERKHAEAEIQNQLDELRRWYDVTLDREGRVLELKQEVNELLKKHGEALRYGNQESASDKQDTGEGV